MRRGGGDREGAGARERGRRVSQLASSSRRAAASSGSRPPRLPARRPLRGSSDAAPLPPLRRPGPRWAQRPRPAGGGGRRRRALRFASSTQAAGISGPSARRSAPLRRRKGQLRPELDSRGRARLRGASVAAARGSGSRAEGRGELTDRSATQRGRNATAARGPPRSLREWHVPDASWPPSPTPRAGRGLPARFPARPPRRACGRGRARGQARALRRRTRVSRRCLLRAAETC